jgi:hypothetical protein
MLANASSKLLLACLLVAQKSVNWLVQFALKYVRIILLLSEFIKIVHN